MSSLLLKYKYKVRLPLPDDLAISFMVTFFLPFCANRLRATSIRTFRVFDSDVGINARFSAKIAKTERRDKCKAQLCDLSLPRRLLSS